MDETITVWIEEEYGYRYWCWDTGMTEAELVAWWKSLNSIRELFTRGPIGTGSKLTGLPGTVRQIDDVELDANTRIGRNTYDAEGDLLEMAPHRLDVYTMHLHENEDSCLVLPRIDENDLGKVLNFEWKVCDAL